MLHLCWEGGGGGSERAGGGEEGGAESSFLSSGRRGSSIRGVPHSPRSSGRDCPALCHSPGSTIPSQATGSPKTAGCKACSKDSAFGRVETGLGGCSSFFGWDRLLASSPVAICSSEPSQCLGQSLGTLTRMLRDISTPAQGFQGSSSILGLAPSRAGMSKPGSIRCWQRCRMRCFGIWEPSCSLLLPAGTGLDAFLSISSFLCLWQLEAASDPSLCFIRLKFLASDSR